ELRQVMRAASGIEQHLLRVPFDLVTGVYIKVNRAVPQASCLFIEVEGIEPPVLLGVGDEAALGMVHRRLCSDLATARNMPPPPRPTPGRGRGQNGMQAA